MATLKRAYEDVDPDYTDACEQQTKRQRELEQDAKQSVIRRVQCIIKNEFRKEINNKEMELHQVDRRLNEARLMMDRLRACIVSTYYGQINQFGTSEMSRTNGPPSSIHPAVKKHLGKAPSQYDMKPDVSVSQMQSSSKQELSLNEVSDFENSLHQRNETVEEQHSRTSEMSSAYQSPPASSRSNASPNGILAIPSAGASYDDRRARLKIKKKIIIGNVSKYIPIDHREANDKSSHKWMVYVRGPKSEPDISGYVKKVWFFLHHSYKPNDLVEISSPPFHLTRRGWGEFPVRVQLHFVDPRNKKVDIIHQLKLDKTFSGLQTLGAETMVELDLEKDFFESDMNCSSNYTKPTPSCSFSSISSAYHQEKLSSNLVSKAANSASDELLVSSQNGRILSSELSQKILTSEHSQKILSSELSQKILSAEHSQEIQSRKSEANNSIIDVTSGNHKIVIKKEPSESYKARVSEICDTVSETEKLTGGSEKSSEEYHMTIAHDTDENEDRSRQKERLLVNRGEAGNDKSETVVEKNSANSLVIQDSQGCTSTLEKVQRALPSATPNTKTTLTIISKPQWINPENLNTLSRRDPLPISLQVPLSKSAASESVKPPSTANVVVSEPESSHLAQASSYELMDSNGYSVKSISSSTATNIKQLCPTVLSSVPSLPFSLSVLPILKTAPVVTSPVICSGQSSTLLSLSLPQNVPLSSENNKLVVGASVPLSSENNKLVVGASVVPSSQHVHQKPKDSQLSNNSSDVKKVIIVKPSTSGITQLVSTNTLGSESKLVLQPKLSGPRQVSLLTGRVFTPQTPPSVANKISSANHGTNEALLANNRLVARQISDQATTLGKSAPGAQMLLLKPVNHTPLSVSPSGHWLSKPHTSTNHNVNNLVKQGLISQVLNVSIVNPEDPSIKSVMPSSSLFSNCISVSNPNIKASQPRQTINSSNIILHVPGQVQHQLIDTQDISTQPKMSAIGITKHGKNAATVPALNTNLKPTTDEERKRNQYQVLMAWKQNRHLHAQDKQVIKIARDRIEGDADVIPELNLHDYTSMRALLKATVKLHPLVQAGINKLTHPYCAESLQQWNTWTLGKQLGSEWHRACFALKYLRTLVGTSGCFRGEQLMTTRQLVRWCRLHAFSPFVAVAKTKRITTEDLIQDDSNPLQNSAHSPSFTPAESLQLEMLADVTNVGDDNCGQDLDVVDVMDIDADIAKKKAGTKAEGDDAGRSLEWLPASDGALFVSDELRKRGIKLQPNELEPGVMAYSAADMLYTAMQEFVADVLRETVAVSLQQHTPHSSPVEITRRDVHKALTQLPEAAFSCNKFLGKADIGSDGGGR